MFITFSLDVLALFYLVVVEAAPTGDCPPDLFWQEDVNFCCYYCSPGKYLGGPCTADMSPSVCYPCEKDTFLSKPNKMKECQRCSQCDNSTEIEVARCLPDQNRTCECREGFEKPPGLQWCRETNGNGGNVGNGGNGDKEYGNTKLLWWLLSLLLIPLGLLGLLAYCCIKRRKRRKTPRTPKALEDLHLIPNGNSPTAGDDVPKETPSPKLKQPRTFDKYSTVTLEKDSYLQAVVDVLRRLSEDDIRPILRSLNVPDTDINHFNIPGHNEKIYEYFNCWRRRVGKDCSLVPILKILESRSEKFTMDEVMEVGDILLKRKETDDARAPDPQKLDKEESNDARAPDPQTLDKEESNDAAPLQRDEH